MQKVSRKVTFGFAIGDLGGNLFFTMIGFYLLYYLTDVVNISAAAAGTVLLIGKAWDAVTDPVTGFLSDRTLSRWGRRRPYMFVGSILSLLFMYLMFTRIDTPSPMVAIIYVTVIYCLLNTAYTLVNIPYAALLPEITDDFDARTVLTGYRMAFAVIGTFVGAGAVMPLVSIAGWSMTGTVLGAVMLITAMITIFLVTEPVHTDRVMSGSFFSTYAQALSNRVFLSAMIPWTLFIMGTTMVQGALVYYFTYIFLDQGLFQLALMLLLSVSLLCIPLWVAISKRIGKRSCYIIGMGIMSFGVLIFSLAGPLIGKGLSTLVMAISGIGLSTHYVMPHAILPDVVEHDSIGHGGARREGVFSSLWTFSSKIGQAMALAVSGWVLTLFGYIPLAEQSPEALLGIKIVCGPLPVICYLAGILLLRHYPITREYYQRMMEGSRKL